jgi:hypothetical protein
MWAAPEQLGALTIDGESAQSRGGGGEGHRSQISLPSRPKCTKTGKKQAVLHMFWQINRRKCRFLLKSTYEMFFEEYINFKIVHYLSHCGVIPV